MTAPPALAAAAAEYVSRGWAVFPVEPGGKRPVGQLVPHGLKQASVEQRDVERWWAKLPDANIGLRTGLSFDVLDIDGPEGMEALDIASSEAYSVIGPTCTTGGGGHHVYVAPTGVGNKAGLLPKVDWRGAGGYVVAPPSVHASGRCYEWLDGQSPGELSPAPVPGWLRRLLEPERPSVAAARPLPVGDDRYQRYALAVLERVAGRVALAVNGERNDALNRAAHAVGTVLVAGGLDLVQVVGALETAGLRVGLEGSEVRATVRSGLGAGLQRPRSIS